MAYKRIREKDLEVHRRWMIRNYALTFAGVMLRVWVPISGAAGIEFTAAYTVIAWMCWVPNLIFAQWIIHRTLPVTGRASVSNRGEVPQAAQTEL
jgi:hypothetical protein